MQWQQGKADATGSFTSICVFMTVESEVSLYFLVFQSNHFLFSPFCHSEVLKYLLEIKLGNQMHTAGPIFFYSSYLTLTLQNLETIDSSGKLLKHSIN